MTKGKAEESIALYRKYRPQKFKDILGQEHIVSVLEGSIKKNAILHAYLFAGTRGTGKTSIARIFAQEIGTSEKDLYEIDAASNRGIDDIRELRERVLSLPFDSTYKVYIIDEVHMLTKEAFNALLKTLEEPPQHVVFVLATTEFGKLPETIVSRCQSFTFKKPSRLILKEMIVAVAKEEGYALEPSSADLIALLAEGSFRDAHGILQKIIVSTKDKKVSVKEVEVVTGAPRGALVNDVLEAIHKNELNTALAKTHEAINQNVDMKIFLKLLMERLRAVLLIRYAKDLEKELEEEYADTDFMLLKRMAHEGKSLNSTVLSRLLEAHEATGHSYVKELPLELALIAIIEGE